MRINKAHRGLISLKIVLLIIVVFVVSLLIIYLLGRLIFLDLDKDYKSFKSVKVGMGESQVQELLGEPDKVYYASTAPEHYYVEYYEYKKRDITNKVFIYPRMEYIAYVYFDHENKVEYVYIGGTKIILMIHHKES